MASYPDNKVSTFYLWIVLLLMLILPVTSISINIIFFGYRGSLIGLIGVWFNFWSIGVRLFTAGFKQVIKPIFTAKDIFHMQHAESSIIVRELGFANICLGATAIISLFIPEWAISSAFAGGLYMGIAGIYHIIKKPVSPNEIIAMVSDLFIFVVIVIYIGFR